MAQNTIDALLTKARNLHEPDVRGAVFVLEIITASIASPFGKSRQIIR
jgi:hypothetical protein